MVFVKDSLAAREAGKKGGNTGVKYLSTLSKTKLKKLASKAGKQSAADKRAIREERALAKNAKRAEKKVDNIMHNYLI